MPKIKPAAAAKPRSQSTVRLPRGTMQSTPTNEEGLAQAAEVAVSRGGRGGLPKRSGLSSAAASDPTAAPSLAPNPIALSAQTVRQHRSRNASTHPKQGAGPEPAAQATQEDARAARPVGDKNGGRSRRATSPVIAPARPEKPDQPPVAHSTATAVVTASGKQARVIAALRRLEGATVAEMMQLTGWLSHSVRGLLSGSLKRKLGLAVTSTPEPGRGRVYRISTPAPAERAAGKAERASSKPAVSRAHKSRAPDTSAAGLAR